MVTLRSGTQYLTGWKEIANYLGKGVRTVQRLERDLGLPIHRPNRKSAGSVIAAKKELDDWVKASPTRVGSMLKHWPTEQTNKVGAQFLRIDSELALTFSTIALGERDEGRRKRTVKAARRAYDAIMRLRKKILLADAERNKLDANLQMLKNELQRLGQSF